MRWDFRKLFSLLGLGSLFFLTTSCGSGSSSTPVPPQEIPLEGSIIQLIDIPYASNPVVSTTATEISSTNDAIIDLRYFQNDDDYPIDEKFVDGTSRGYCVHSFAFAKAVGVNTEADQILCNIKVIQDLLETTFPTLYENDAENILKIQINSSYVKVKLSFSSDSEADVLSNITSMTMHVCRGNQLDESDMQQIQYIHYNRSGAEGDNNDSLEMTSKYQSEDGDTRQVVTNTETNSDLEIIGSKIMELAYEGSWTDNGGGNEHGAFDIVQGVSNIDLSGYGQSTRVSTRTTWQLDSIGSIFINDTAEESYNYLLTEMGDAAIHFIEDSGSERSNCVDASDLQDDTCITGNAFGSSSALDTPPEYVAESTLAFSGDEIWDCSGTATSIDISSYSSEIQSTCANYLESNPGSSMYCNSID